MSRSHEGLFEVDHFSSGTGLKEVSRETHCFFEVGRLKDILGKLKNGVALCHPNNMFTVEPEVGVIFCFFFQELGQAFDNFEIVLSSKVISSPSSIKGSRRERIAKRAFLRASRRHLFFERRLTTGAVWRSPFPIREVGFLRQIVPGILIPFPVYCCVLVRHWTAPFQSFLFCNSDDFMCIQVSYPNQFLSSR